MTELTHKAPKDRFAFLRNPEVRAIFYQVLILGGVALAAYEIFRNTVSNLEQRGIASGLGFLRNESGFGISETPPVPMLQGGVLYFLIALFAGLLITYLISRRVHRQGRTIQDDTRLVVAVVALIFVVPALVFYFTYPTVQTETFTESGSYGLAMLTGLENTVKVSFIGCILATLLGLILGIARLSTNWLISKLATAYIEVIRNIPLLLQIFFWYFAVIRTLPRVRQSLTLWDVFIFNNRGIFLPAPLPQASVGVFLLTVFASLIAIYFWARHARIIRDLTGHQLPVLYPSLILLVVLPGLVWVVLGRPFHFEFPVLRGFNYQGGLVLTPEYAAMLVALVMYTTAFIAEVVRSGIEAISKGQREAASAVGLRSGQVLRLVILPQALRVIIPPLTSQYLNLTKNSSLGVAIAYPELVSVGGTILNQSGQAIEVIALTMAVYLTFSLLISLFMNWYNVKVRLIER